MTESGQRVLETGSSSGRSKFLRQRKQILGWYSANWIRIDSFPWCNGVFLFLNDGRCLLVRGEESESNALSLSLHKWISVRTRVMNFVRYHVNKCS